MSEHHTDDDSSLADRVRILETASKVHAHQVADIVVIFSDLSRELPKQIGVEIRAGMCELASDVNIDRMVGKALGQLRKRASDTAADTAWTVFKSGAGRLLQLAGLLWLAWTIGGAPLLGKVWAWITSNPVQP